MFPKRMEIPAEPGRFMVGHRAATLDDGISHTFSGILFDRCRYQIKAFRKGPKRISSVFGPSSDALDTISRAEAHPAPRPGDLVCSENIGAYGHASSRWFDGFPPAQVLRIQQSVVGRLRF
jgi:ornithine decarboxylase